MKKKEKKVISIGWNSTHGEITFRERYEDGSVGPVESTSLETDDPRKFLLLKSRIEKERFGRTVIN